MSNASYILPILVLLLSLYSVLKFAFFFVLPYERRRAMLDKAYDVSAMATGTSDPILLTLVAALAIALLGSGSEPVAFLGRLFVGATLIQLFFHAFHSAVPPERQAPAPSSPLKQMSYAIQDRPIRAWKEMAVYTAIVSGAAILYFVR